MPPGIFQVTLALGLLLLCSLVLLDSTSWAQSLSCVRLFVTPWVVAPQGSFVHGIFQARILEWAVIASGLLPLFLHFKIKSLLPHGQDVDL